MELQFESHLIWTGNTTLQSSQMALGMLFNIYELVINILEASPPTTSTSVESQTRE